MQWAGARLAVKMPMLMSVMNSPSRMTQSLCSTNCVTSSRPSAALVDAHEQRVPLADDALAEHRGGDGDARPFGKLQQFVLQPETMHLDAGDDHRPLGWPRCGARPRPPPRPGPRDRWRAFCGVGVCGPSGTTLDHVARQFDVARPAVANHGRQHAVDLAQGRVRIVQLGLGAADAAKHLGLRVKVLHAMVQQRIVEPLAHAGRAADDHHRRLLGIGPGDRVAQAQPAHAIGDADRPDAVEAGVGVGGEPGAVLPRAADQVDRALLQHRVERQHVVAGDAENVADAEILEPADQVVADRHAPDGRLVGLLGTN